MGRGSASEATTTMVIMTMVVVALLLMVHIGQIDAAIYTVGDSDGWTFNVASWPNGKRFRAGDTLVFKYGREAHNVVAVNKGGYNTCKTPPGSKTYQSGNDQIKLVKGQNNFICNFPGHCQSGMKIAINAA